MARGHITKRGKDSWTVVLELPRDPQTKQRRQKSVTVRGPRKQAEMVMTEMLAELDRGYTFLAPSKLTVNQYFDRYLEGKKNKNRGTTHLNYQAALAAFRTYIGSLYLLKVSPMDLENAVNAMIDDGYHGNTVRQYLVCLKTALKQAKKLGQIQKNPAENITLPKMETKEILVWTQQECEQFELKTRKSRYHMLFVLGLATGARIGELLALRWSDVNLDQGVISINRTVSGDGYQSPKTISGKRKVPVEPGTARLLREHRKNQFEERLKKGSNFNPENLVFCTKSGKRIAHTAAWITFKRLIDKAGVSQIRVHDLRHTHATLLLLAGVPVPIVSARLGHKDPSITLRVYSHLLPDSQQIAVAVMNDIFKGWSAVQSNP